MTAAKRHLLGREIVNTKIRKITKSSVLKLKIMIKRVLQAQKSVSYEARRISWAHMWELAAVNQLRTAQSEKWGGIDS